MVGREILEVLQERHFAYGELLLAASARSVGEVIGSPGKAHTVMGLDGALAAKPDIAIFSAGGGVSLAWAPKFAQAGAIVIDNSSAWRADPTKKLIVPEINGHSIMIDDRIIANPNCSTIQMVLVLAPLHKRYGIRRVVVSTYQSVTGSGKGAVDQMMAERRGATPGMVYPHKIDMNVLPHIDLFQENGYTKEEMKMANETVKILGDENVKVSATCVRVPAIGGHSEAVNIEFDNPYDLGEVKNILSKAPGLVVQDDVKNNTYPMPLTVHKKDGVFVGRIRHDESRENALNLWIVADNLRKGAATNAVQIAEYLADHHLIY